MPKVKGAAHPWWKGGSYISSEGYRMVYAKGHPRCWENDHVREHILVAEQKLGRPLLPDEVVHHINGIKTDNRPENLEVKTNSQHVSEHFRGKPKPWQNGENNHSAKLTSSQVAEIRELKGKMTNKEIANKYGVGTYAIWAIFVGRTWKSAPVQEKKP